ncbi:hypothetical protein M436DRAFT_65136 [Aureobasidium namibiae CBS 147.97]|uniref:Uncharacterized protein n=1 Tax=Aureobasidium namibiae CBS 147.97 TaxID=1043004 RepID=A0A074XAL9_9PEZI|nr:uncharacterized protein M436DRAFT_65136 [Aureobasidium namibiae CBS 147.97]KEQ71646.1 hypothetical protein M436DRAFT_65136 [Aureobasidium namibiae CBS 147.97]
MLMFEPLRSAGAFYSRQVVLHSVADALTVEFHHRYQPVRYADVDSTIHHHAKADTPSGYLFHRALRHRFNSSPHVWHSSRYLYQRSTFTSFLIVFPKSRNHNLVSSHLERYICFIKSNTHRSLYDIEILLIGIETFFPRLNWCMTIQPCPHPSNACPQSCSLQSAPLFATPKSRLVDTTPPSSLSASLFLGESCLGDSATSLGNCISTLGHLDVLDDIAEIDVVMPVAGGKCAWEYERESVVRLLQSFPKLKKLYIRTGEELTVGLVDEVQQVLTKRSDSGGNSFGHYWWWYSMDSQSEGRIYGDEKSVTRSNCRMVRLLRRGKRRPPFVCSYQDIQGHHATRGIVVSSHLTYLFVLV